MAIRTANNQSLTEITELPSAVPSAGSLVLLETQTASSDSTIDFTDNIDDTYDEYVFKCYNIHPATDDTDFGFQGSTDGGSSYGVTITSTHFSAYHNEAGTTTNLGYDGSGNRDLAQSTNLQSLSSGTGNGNDECYSGTLHIFNPSSTTFVKHFIAIGNHYNSGDYSINNHMAGYFNTTSAIDAIQFKFASGNTDAGVIKMYGVT
jgi:hypothetical protein